jgi:DNA-directed RNA polymerase specialized sigma24 family protein
VTAERRGPPAELAQVRERFIELVAEIRPKLHRYCARLTGSVIDGAVPPAAARVRAA